MQYFAIDKSIEGVTEDQLRPHLPAELAATLQLYLSDKVRNFYFRKDRPGVILLMEVEHKKEAENLLNTLPLVQLGLLAFDLVPVGPLEPLELLLAKN